MFYTHILRQLFDGYLYQIDFLFKMIIEKKDHEILERRDCPNVQHPSCVGVIRLGGVGMLTMPGPHGARTRGGDGYWGALLPAGLRSEVRRQEHLLQLEFVTGVCWEGKKSLICPPGVGD